MSEVKKNGAKVSRVAKLHEDPKLLLNQEAQDHDFLNGDRSAPETTSNAMKSDVNDSAGSHTIAQSDAPTEKEEARRRVYAASISNTLTHCGEFIATATTCGGGYACNIAIYQVANLQTMRSTAYVLVTGVDTAETAYKYAVAFRKSEFSGLDALCTLVINEMILSGADETTIEQVRALVRKLRGERKVPINVLKPEDHISASQVDFDNRVANFERLVLMVSADPNYDPATDPLKVLALETKLEVLRTANDDVIVKEAELNAARTARNDFFNTPRTGLVDVFINAKKVILTNFGIKSEQYKRVKGLPFRKIR